ncbi:hypothetical protein [Oricola indica]|jgi:uncharacterized repeat protein (TIGR01451 family)|uniref:hypothetical protein n=1 Tax=Oricola indica TaxID=2872591 RepID=UPI001CBDB6D5|nr:hypothetical protein [Oricola indica]
MSIIARPVAADIINSAVASGVHDGASVQSGGAQVSTSVEPGVASMHVEVEAAIGGDSAPGLPEGDRIGFIIAVSNDGNVGLTGVRLTLELKQGAETFAPSDPPGYSGGDVENPGILDRGETWRFAAGQLLQRSNVEAGSEITATVTAVGKVDGRTITDITALDVEIPPLQGVERRLISLAHTPSTTEASVGDQVDYTITVSNRSTRPLSVRLRALLAEDTALVPGSVFIDRKVIDIVQDEQRIDFGTLEVPARGSVSLRYLGEIREASLRGYQVNTAQIADPETLIPLLPPSTAAVKTGEIQQSSCAGISLLVYEDKNRNGVADPTEARVSGVRIALDGGRILTTGLKGGFTSPCLPVSRLANLEERFELDEATLEEGYHAVTSNPVSLRLQPGSSNTVSFGVASARVVRVDLNAAAFLRNEAVPDAELEEGITRLISLLAREPSVVRLTYFAHREAIDLPEERLAAVQQAIRDHWAASGGGYELEIEVRVVQSES